MVLRFDRREIIYCALVSAAWTGVLLATGGNYALLHIALTASFATSGVFFSWGCAKMGWPYVKSGWDGLVQGNWFKKSPSEKKTMDTKSIAKATTSLKSDLAKDNKGGYFQTAQNFVSGLIQSVSNGLSSFGSWLSNKASSIASVFRSAKDTKPAKRLPIIKSHTVKASSKDGKRSCCAGETPGRLPEVEDGNNLTAQEQADLRMLEADAKTQAAAAAVVAADAQAIAQKAQAETALMAQADKAPETEALPTEAPPVPVAPQTEASPVPVAPQTEAPPVLVAPQTEALVPVAPQTEALVPVAPQTEAPLALVVNETADALAAANAAKAIEETRAQELKPQDKRVSALKEGRAKKASSGNASDSGSDTDGPAKRTRRQSSRASSPASSLATKAPSLETLGGLLDQNAGQAPLMAPPADIPAVVVYQAPHSPQRQAAGTATPPRAHSPAKTEGTKVRLKRPTNLV